MIVFYKFVIIDISNRLRVFEVFDKCIVMCLYFYCFIYFMFSVYKLDL